MDEHFRWFARQDRPFSFRRTHAGFSKALSSHVFPIGTTIAYRLLGAVKLPEIKNYRRIK
jgi:hypothetical protein